MNDENLFKNKNNQRSYDESKYKVIKKENIDLGNFERNEQILIKDGN